MVDKSNKANIIRYRDNTTDEQKFYESTEWRKLSNSVKKKHLYKCVECYKEGIFKIANVTHHLLPIAESDEGWERRLDEGQLVPLCHKHHNNYHNRHGGESVKTKKERISKKIEYNGGVNLDDLL